MVDEITEIKECPDCAYPDLIYNQRKQQVVCKSCGLIYEPLTPKDDESYLGYLGLAGKGSKVLAKSRKTMKKKLKRKKAVKKIRRKTRKR